jgi:hypothetical protein
MILSENFMMAQPLQGVFRELQTPTGGASSRGNIVVAAFLIQTACPKVKRIATVN